MLAKKAVNQIRDIRRRLDNLERAITGSGMVLDDGNGMVSDPKGVSLAEELGSTGAALDAAARRALKERYQHEVNILMQDANQADRNLAIAIEGATGQIPLDQVRPSSPDSRPVSGLPGMPAAQVDEAAKKKSSMYDPLGTVRYVPMKLPKGWHDDPSNPRTDLGRHYARGVRFGPYDRGVTGPWSDTLNPKDAPKGRPDKVTIPFPKQEKEIDIKVYQSTRLRADGATPTSMREVTINGKQYLKIEYQYDYSASRSTAATINEIPLSPHPEWHKVSTEQVRVLQDRYGVQAPRPGA
ncbi:hypothetical protein [Gordonia crocea]|uniref:hypothetical protein n=1 Tax=Gordonia crocea TaxID=589162 RepID=UPI001379E6E3|nr:hypothetical protein [Gordonia crocea]